MATKDSKKAEAPSEVEPTAPPVSRSAPAAAMPPAPPTPPVPVVSFDRWFATTGRPQHHKAGMQRFAATKGKKTVAAWNAVFARY